MNFKPIITALLFAVCLALASTEARADTFTVNVNTSALISGGSYFVNFQLTNGDGTANNNTITLNSFSFGGGSAGAASTVQTSGGASGSLQSGVTLTDSAFLNDFVQQFTAGSSLQFNITLTGAFAGGTPDQFSFAILQDDGTGNPGGEVNTTGPGDALVILDIRPPINVNSFQTFGDPGEIQPPTVTLVAPTAVPEPTTLLLLGTGLAGIGAARKRRRSH